MAASNTPFPCFKTTGDDKHDIEIYTEDLRDYCVMQNWYDSSKETEAQRWTKPDKAIACLRASLPPAARAIYKYSLGLSDEDQKKLHLVIDALRKFYGASIGVSGERQKFLRLLQEENEPIASWETRVRNQGAQCEYEDFADELMRDQFIAGLTSEALRVKLIGKGHRHRDSQIKVALREVVEAAKCFEATTYANQLMKTARGNQEQVNFAGKQKVEKETVKRSEAPCYWCSGNHKEPRQQHCPAFRKRCNNCGIIGHFSRACRSRGGQPRGGQPQRREANLVETEQDEEAFASEAISASSTGKKSATKFFAHLHLVYKGKTKVIRAQIDSASTCNTIPEGSLHKLFPGIRISKSKASICTYGNQILHPKGQVTLCCERRGKFHTLNFLVVDVPQEKPPLLSGSDAQALQFLKIFADEVHMADNVVKNPSSHLVLGSITKQIVLQHYANIFEPWCGKPLGNPLHIEMDPSVTPVHAPRRRIPVSKLDKVNEELSRLCDNGTIKPVTQPTDWLSNILVKEKPNGNIRICIDPSQTINKAIRRPVYTIPTIEEKLPLLKNAKVFTIVDVSEAFHTIELDDESALLTTFMGPDGRYCFTRMPFGISSGPEEYQRRQHEFLHGLLGVINIADDICIFGCGDTIEDANVDHDRNLVHLLDKSSDYNLHLSAKKLQFKATSVTFMGHRLTEKGLEPDSAKISAIMEMPRPEDKAGVQRFLGMCQYLSKFCPNLSASVLPLRELTKQDAAFIWSNMHESAFHAAKVLISKATALRYYDPSLPVTMQVDASEDAIGGVLLQQDQPICFTSHTLSNTEKQYAQIEKECLAIVTCMNKWHQYLYGKQHITVHTDHQPLESIFKKPISKAPRRLQRMMLKLLDYQFKVTYKKGKELHVADTLSRAALKDSFESQQSDVFRMELVEMDLKPSNVTADTLERIRTETSKDPVLSILNSATMTGWPDERKSVPEEIRGFWSYREEITADNGVLFKLDQVIVPSSLRAEMLRKIHKAHQGYDSSIRRARECLFWPGMQSDIQKNLFVMWNLQPVPRRAANRAHALTRDTLTSLVKDKCRPVRTGWKAIPRDDRSLQRLF